MKLPQLKDELAARAACRTRGSRPKAMAAAGKLHSLHTALLCALAAQSDVMDT